MTRPVHERQGYHHGQLRDALIEAAEEIIREGGIESFSLREAARRAQVSPGAPAHHFGNARGLLTEVALRAYADLGQALSVSDGRKDESPAAALQRIGVAYVRFALGNPGHFRLMFRSDLVNRSDTRYQAVSTAALTGLGVAAQALARAQAGRLCAGTGAVGAEGDPGFNDVLVRGQVFSIWSTMHGMAHLVLEGKAAYLFGGSDPDQFVKEYLPALLGQIWPESPATPCSPEP